MSSFFFARLLHCFCSVEKLYITFDWGLNRANAFSPIVQTKPAENVDKNGSVISNTVSKVKSFENESFWNRSGSFVDR